MAAALAPFEWVGYPSAMHLLEQTATYLAATLVMVPIAKRLGLGSTLGYLVAGVSIGPSGLGLVEDPLSILHFAEFGVVLLLFLVGLELEVERLAMLRRRIFGVGGLQVLITGLLAGAAAKGLGLTWIQAGVVGAGLALSSTALALQVLGEQGELALPHGRYAFAILLFHDMAVIPMLALVPLLGEATPGGRPAWQSALLALGTIAAVVFAGRFVIRSLLRLATSTRSSEVSTAAALFVVVGMAVLMEMVGLSMALGAFLAGVLLADSEYRHELEANIQPFKGLLLGLFFIAIGMSAKLALVASRPTVVLGLVAGIVLLKAAVLYGLARVVGLSPYGRFGLAITLAHGGVFAFLLFGVAADAGVLDRALTDLLVVVVALSMAATPLLFAARGALLKHRPRGKTFEQEEEAFDHAQVIIAGFGRFGQVVGRMLATRQVPFTAIDADPEHLDFVRRFGAEVRYGDSTRLEILRACRVEEARVMVIAIDDVEASVATARQVREHFPHVQLVARARNRRHAWRLMDLGVGVVFRETFASSIEAARETLVELGLPYHEAYRAARKFREHDERLLERQHEVYEDGAKLMEMSKLARDDLEELFRYDSLAGPPHRSRTGE